MSITAKIAKTLEAAKYVPVGYTLSPEFDTSHDLPTREGLYRVRELVDIPFPKSYSWYSYWDGQRFGYWSLSPKTAYTERDLPTGCVAVKWQGIVPLDDTTVGAI